MYHKIVGNLVKNIIYIKLAQQTKIQLKIPKFHIPNLL